MPNPSDLPDAFLPSQSRQTCTGRARAVQTLAWLILVLMLVRAFALWAADPLLGYANTFDQVRTTVVFGLKPRDSGQEIHAGTPDQPWRFYVKAAPMGKPIYPSSDLLAKAVQVAVMAVFSSSNGVMDIKVAGATLLIVWMAGVLWVFVRLLARPAAALGFALWCCVLADPINLLFLNTVYAEFSAFIAATLMIGALWLWLEKRLSTRWTLLTGCMLALFLALNRNQWMYLGMALLPTALALAYFGRRGDRPMCSRRIAIAGGTLMAIMVCVVPIIVFQGQYDLLKASVSANRIDTVMGMVLPASKNPQAILRAMQLPESCLAMSGKIWYTAPVDEFKTHCPQIMNLPPTHLVFALMTEPRIMAPIIRNISISHRGFLQNHLGQVEGKSRMNIASLGGYVSASMDGVIARLSPAWARALIWLLMIAPFALSAVALIAGARRWAVMFMTQGSLFNYVLFSSIFGDGYFDLARHAVLCFSFGALLPILLLTGACARFLKHCTAARSSLSAAGVEQPRAAIEYAISPDSTRTRKLLMPRRNPVQSQDSFQPLAVDNVQQFAV